MRMQRTRGGQVALALLAGIVATVVVVCRVSGRRAVLEEREGYERDEPRQDPLGGFAPRGMGKVSYAATLGQRPDMEHFGFYDPKTDPWLKADEKDSYKFWSAAAPCFACRVLDALSLCAVIVAVQCHMHTPKDPTFDLSLIRSHQINETVLFFAQELTRLYSEPSMSP